MSEWKKVKLSELGEIVGGATPSTKREEYYNGKIPWLTPKDLSGYGSRYISKGERSITQEGLNSCSAKILPKDSVLFTSRAPIGYVAIAENEICTNQGFKSIVPNQNTDPLFLFYLLKHNKERIEAMGSGTTFKEVSGSVMKNIEVDVPEYEEQRRISAILTSIDNLIELNNRMNKNLEAQAQAIFKSWFVDFEPFLDGEFDDSDLGKIPKGWSVNKLGEVVDSIDNRGKTPPLETSTTDYPIIDVKALSGNYRIVDFNNCSKFVSEDTYNSFFRSGHPKKLDILISTVGSLAEMKLFYGNIGCVAQNVVAFRSKVISPYYLYQYLQNIKNDLISYNIGSVQPSIKVTHILKHSMLIPDTNTLKLFDEHIANMSTLIFNSYKQSQILSALRDTLLPKLMSGEIDVKEEV